MAQQHRFDLARLDAEAAQLQLRIGRPRKSSTPSRAPARKVAAAVHAASRRPKRIGHEALRREPRARRDSRAQAPPPQCKARPQLPPAQAASPHPAHKSAYSRSDARSGHAALIASHGPLSQRQIVASVGPYSIDMATATCGKSQRCDASSRVKLPRRRACQVSRARNRRLMPGERK